jgi:predicted RNA-binding protein with PUA-like domain
MACWLMKTEPGCYGIKDLKKDGSTYWDGIRNFQARNFIRDDIKVGDMVLFYHSNAEPSGIAGVAKVSKAPYPDFTAWDPTHEHFDPKSKADAPTWFMVDIAYVSTFKRFLSLDDLRQIPELQDLLVLKKGNRLSVMPVSQEHCDLITKLGKSYA